MITETGSGFIHNARSVSGTETVIRECYILFFIILGWTSGEDKPSISSQQDSRPPRSGTGITSGLTYKYKLSENRFRVFFIKLEICIFPCCSRELLERYLRVPYSKIFFIMSRNRMRSHPSFWSWIWLAHDLTLFFLNRQVVWDGNQYSRPVGSLSVFLLTSEIFNKTNHKPKSCLVP
jgi:hypothetical protein